MRDWSHETIDFMGRRSEMVVQGTTWLFAMAGPMLAGLSGGQSMWGMWIPLCFITIPTIHYLCREVLRLRRRIEDLERRLGR